MPPDDPLGRHGPSLENFLRKRPVVPEHKKQPCPYGKCSFVFICIDWSRVWTFTFMSLHIFLHFFSNKEKSARTDTSASTIIQSASTSHYGLWLMNFGPLQSCLQWRQWARVLSLNVALAQWLPKEMAPLRPNVWHPNGSLTPVSAQWPVNLQRHSPRLGSLRQIQCLHLCLLSACPPCNPPRATQLEPWTHDQPAAQCQVLCNLLTVPWVLWSTCRVYSSHLF